MWYKEILKYLQYVKKKFKKPLFLSPQLKYKEDYNKNVKGQWCETPYFDIAIARMAMDNLSDVRLLL